MRVHHLAVFLLVVVVSCGSSSGGNESREAGSSSQTTAGTMKTVADANTEFALDLYGVLRRTPGNLFVSPFSISTALAMTYAGAREITGKEMETVLRLPGQEATHPAFRALLDSLETEGKDSTHRLHIANRIWGQRGLGFLPEYLELTGEAYHSKLEEMDFQGDAESARRIINDWVAEKTADKIKDLLPPGTVNTNTRMVLTNAVYFKGDWASRFDSDDTREGSFWVASESSVTTPMMHQRNEYRLATLDGLQMLELPYEGSALAMVVLLPLARDGIEELEKRLTVENLRAWRESLTPGEVDVLLPRFEMRSKFQMGRTLAAMGMPTAFSDRADFSGMTGRTNLAIDDVVHEAYVKVNEEGTEAAAATGVVMKLTSVTERLFHADHPFLFLIWDSTTQSVLFLGRMANPAG